MLTQERLNKSELTAPIINGMLRVQEKLPNSRYLCACECGNTRIVKVGHFNTGAIKSCGCHVNRHGHARVNARSRAYISYFNMIARCHNPTNKRYKDYGAKGIAVCDRWISGGFSVFLLDMGECNDEMTIDRIDNKKGYSPENCRWTDRKTNQRNRDFSVTWVVHGIQYETLREAADAIGVSSHTIKAWCAGRVAAGRVYAAKPDCFFIKKYPL